MYLFSVVTFFTESKVSKKENPLWRAGSLQRLFELFRLCAVHEQHVVIGTSHGFYVVAHGLAPCSFVAPLVRDAETETVNVALVCRNADLEDAEAFATLGVNLVVFVRVLYLFKALVLAEFHFVDDRAFKRKRKGVLQAQFNFPVRLDDGCFGRFNQIALLRNVLIGAVMNLADTAHFAHVWLGDEVYVAADGGHVGRNFKIFAVGRTGTAGQKTERHGKK